ncbi:MAG: YihY/virulence factor BrkB family protein [Anaerolineae bacterium]|nr:YihY/virulence factor BrkB family protein [Anaerolineae bacterium]
MTRDQGQSAGKDAASRENAWYKAIYNCLGDARRALIDRCEVTYKRADEWSGGRLGIVRTALSSFQHERGSEAAASLAYYALFSIFPLVLFMIGLGSLLIDKESAFRHTVQILNEAIPAPTDLITENVREVLALRGSVTLVSLAALLWSATRFFDALTQNIDRAWPQAGERAFVKTRLIGMGMVTGMAILMLVSFLLTAAARYLARAQLPLGGLDGALYGSLAWRIGASFSPWFVTLVLFLLLYRWVPNAKVRTRAAFWGALVAATVWQLAASGFAWYVSNVGRYRLIYGSLGAIIILMVWVYLAAWITLFGAHLTAAVGKWYGDLGGLGLCTRE